MITICHCRAKVVVSCKVRDRFYLEYKPGNELDPYTFIHSQSKTSTRPRKRTRRTHQTPIQYKEFYNET